MTAENEITPEEALARKAALQYAKEIDQENGPYTSSKKYNSFLAGVKYANEHANQKETVELLSTLKETEEQLRWLYNNAEFEGHMPIRSAIDKANEVIKKYA